MPQGFEGMAEAQARLYFFDLVRWTMDRHDAKAQSSTLFPP
jgi:hypothetical protein